MSLKRNGKKQSFLELNETEMRAAGYHVVDAIVDHFLSLDELNVRHEPVNAYTLSEEVFCEEPTPFENVLGDTVGRVFQECRFTSHRRVFSFVPGPGNFISAMADALMSGYNAFAGTWIESAGPAKVELATIDWLRKLAGMPDTAGGLFVSGGSQANLTAMAVARYKKLGKMTSDAVILCSDQTHSSVDRAARILGFAEDQVVKIVCDNDFRMNVRALRKAVEEEKANGRMPFCVVANAGTTNCGAIDPLQEIADLCEDENLWLHVDGAYGAPAMLTERGKNLLKGIDRVDSLTLDPHKWLFQPFEIGCVIVKEGTNLKDTFHILPEYLQDTQQSGNEINFCDYGTQLTRNFRALKLWMSLRTFGIQAFREAIEKGFELSEYTEKVIKRYQEFKVITPPQMAILTFRYQSSGFDDEELDKINRGIVGLQLEDGSSMISSTRLNGRTVLRMCTINPRTTHHDIEETIALLKNFGDRLAHNLAMTENHNPEA